MDYKCRTKDFNVPGKIRYKEHNPRGKKADWISFACTESETDVVMESIGMAMQKTTKRELPAGTLLSQICKEWMQSQAGE